MRVATAARAPGVIRIVVVVVIVRRCICAHGPVLLGSNITIICATVTVRKGSSERTTKRTVVGIVIPQPVRIAVVVACAIRIVELRANTPTRIIRVAVIIQVKRPGRGIPCRIGLGINHYNMSVIGVVIAIPVPEIVIVTVPVRIEAAET